MRSLANIEDLYEIPHHGILTRRQTCKWFKPSSKILYWPFQGGSFFCGSFIFFCLVFAMPFMHVCLYVHCGHLLGKSWSLGSRLWCLTVSLSHSHWYPGSGVVLDCIDSWSLRLYLLRNYTVIHLSRNIDFSGLGFLYDFLWFYWCYCE